MGWTCGNCRHFDEWATQHGDCQVHHAERDATDWCAHHEGRIDAALTRFAMERERDQENDWLDEMREGNAGGPAPKAKGTAAGVVAPGFVHRRPPA